MVSKETPSAKPSGSSVYCSTTSTFCSAASEPAETTVAEMSADAPEDEAEPKTTTGGTSVRTGRSGT